jgi:hypothetical protein
VVGPGGACLARTPPDFPRAHAQEIVRAPPPTPVIAFVGSGLVARAGRSHEIRARLARTRAHA